MSSNEYILTGQPGRTPNALIGTGGNSLNGRGMYVWMEITPELAAEYLAREIVNRTIRQGKVAAYSGDMVAGKWREADAPITIRAGDGAVLDGRHRLNAIIMANTTIGAWVHMVSDDVQPMDMRVDLGAARSITDITGINRRHAAIARALFRVTQWGKSWTQPSVDTVIGIVERVTPEILMLTSTHGMTATGRACTAHVAAATCYSLHLYPSDVESIAAQYNAIAGQNIEYPFWPSVSSAVRQTLEAKASAGPDRLREFVRFARAWSPAGRGFSKVTVRDYNGALTELAPKVAAYIGINS